MKLKEDFIKVEQVEVLANESLYCRTNLESWKVIWNPYAFGLWYFHLLNLFCFRMWLRLWRRNVKRKLLFIMNIRRNSRWEQVRQVSDSRNFWWKPHPGCKYELWTPFLEICFLSYIQCLTAVLCIDLFVCLFRNWNRRQSKTRPKSSSLSMKCWKDMVTNAIVVNAQQE